MENISHYKTCKSKRNFTYGYWIVPNPGQGKPSIVLLHGFPSSSLDWDAQFTYFAKKGYGVIAPDLLGYGGTDKPLDIDAYRARGLTQDVVDVLDNEGIDTAVFIGHDCGILPLSRMINLYPEKIIASVFISFWYLPPDPDFNAEKLNAAIESSFGYWEFFSSDEATDLIKENIDSFYSLVWPKDPAIWKTDLVPKGKFKEWLENNKLGQQYPYWTDEKKKEHQARFLETGVTAPLRWYTGRVKTLQDNGDDAKIPMDRYKITHPTLFIATLQDYVCLPEVGTAIMKSYADNLEIKEIDTSHWVMFEKPDDLNETLDEFISKL
ncbi:Alpha/Beta hydrolase protein [Cyathus striatus]|nr:Alpha/Beta hydrolase protein [Cyathus striatus]